MKKSFLSLALFFVAVISFAQQPQEYKSKLIFKERFYPVLNSQLNSNGGIKLTPFLLPDLHKFNHHLFYKQLLATPQIEPTGKLMQSIRKTFSYAGQVVFSRKKVEYITGITGNGIGLKVRL